MINKKQIRNIYLILFILLTTLFYYQLLNQHWSSVLDQDLTILYNSLLLTSGIEQEYIDHPAFTTFLINSLIFKIFNFFFDYSNNIDFILNSKNTNEILQIYFYISRSLNFFLNIFLVFLFSKILKSLKINYIQRFIFCIIFVFSIGFIISIFLLRSENISLLFLFLSIYTILKNTNNLYYKFFVSGIFFCFAMLAKMQIIFLYIFLIFLIPNVSIKKAVNFSENKIINYYLILSLLAGVFFYIYFQFYIYDLEILRYLITEISIRNKYLDLIIFSISLISIFIFFYFKKNFKTNILYFSLLLNGFVFLIILILSLDQIGFINFNNYNLLRLTNPFQLMMEFRGQHIGDQHIYGAISLNYFFKNILTFFSNYKLNMFELILIVLLFLINLRKKNYILIIFVIFLINTLILNFRYRPTYDLYYIFIYLMFFIYSTEIFNQNMRTKLTSLILIIFLFNSFIFFVIKDHNYNLKQTFSRNVEFNKICLDISSGVAVSDSPSLNYIMISHSKFNKHVLNKICHELN